MQFTKNLLVRHLPYSFTTWDVLQPTGTRAATRAATVEAATAAATAGIITAGKQMVAEKIYITVVARTFTNEI